MMYRTVLITYDGQHLVGDWIEYTDDQFLNKRKSLVNVLSNEESAISVVTENGDFISVKSKDLKHANMEKKDG